MLQFFNPLLLLGALAFLVPLIIHLLNRQRFRRRRWAAMEFLLLAYKKQRRRLRTENLLLLLLRCLIPILLALAIARPFLRDARGLVGLGSTAHHVLVLDSSYSMGLEPAAAQGPFNRMKAIATRLLDRIGARQGQKVSLVIGGVRPTTPLVDDLNVGRAKAIVAGLAQPQDAASDLVAALGAAAKIVADGVDPEFRVYLFTDLQVRAFGDEPAAGAEPAAGEPPAANDFADTAHDLIARIKERGELTLFDVGPVGDEGGHVDNVQISELALVDPLAVARAPIPVEVTVRNLSETSRSVQVTVEQDGGAPTRQLVDLDAGAEQKVEFPLTFRDVGLRTLKASLEVDALAADDERQMVVPVRERVKMLLVEGSDEVDAALQETAHLRSILDPTDGDGGPELAPFQPTVIDTMQFWSATDDFAAYDLVVLANVESVPPEAAEKLESAMQAGTSLWLLLGGRVRPDSYNAHLWAGGRGPLPLQLTGPRGYTSLGPDSYGTEIVDPDHPTMRDLGGSFRDVFEQIAVYKFFATDAGTLGEDAKVAIRLRDEQQSPLLILGTWGRGRVAVLTTTINRRPDRWSDLYLEIASFPLLHPLARWLTVPETNPYNVEVGAVLTAPLRHVPRDVAYVTSERAGSLRLPVGEESQPLPGGLHTLPPCRDTGFSGIYLADMHVERDGIRQPEQLPFAVNVEPVEGTLDYLAHATVRERLAIDRIYRDLPADGNAAIEAGLSELGPLLLLAVLIFVVCEGLLARLVSTRRG